MNCLSQKIYISKLEYYLENVFLYQLLDEYLF